MCVVTSHVKELIEKLEHLPHSPAFLERALLVIRVDFPCHSLSGTTWRSVAAPILGTDLGVRLLNDGEEFYKAHCAIANVLPIKSEAIIEWVEEKPELIARRIDAILTFFGAYDEAREVIRRNKEQLLTSEKYDDLILFGTVLAALYDDESKEFFVNAVEKANSFSTKYSAVHRLAATAIKRTKDLKYGEEILNSIIGNDYISEGLSLERGLQQNLLALIHFKRGEDEKAEGALNEAKMAVITAIEKGNLTSVEKTMAVRYMSQIAINFAQVYLEVNRHTDALAILENNLKFVAAYAPEYKAEALSELSVVRYYAGDYDGSIKMALQSFGYLYHLGSVQSMRIIRKIIVAALMHVGRPSEAKHLVELISSDPLGFHGLGNI